MALKYYIAKINWRQILFHFVAMWLFFHSFKLLAYLLDTKYVDTIILDKSKMWESGANKVIYFLITPIIAGGIGLIVAFILSVIISIKKHWFWINSLMAFLLIFSLLKLDFLGWNYLRFIFLMPGYIFNSWILRLTINGLFLLVLGFYIFFSSRINHLISNFKRKSV
ncbi:MAG: hypothetical protein ABI402_08125 [Ferruginibacter sp.]